MTVTKNVIANYVSQLYIALIGILILPLYIKYMGAEAYGLIAFYAMLQTWFSLLDVGLASTNARETARYRGGELSTREYLDLFSALNKLFVITAVVGLVVLLLVFINFGGAWLNSEELSDNQIKFSLIIMSFIVALRWYGGIHRGVISGYEKFVWLSCFNSTIVTLRFLLVIPVLIWVDSTPGFYFGYQLIVAFIEIFGLCVYASALKPRGKTSKSTFTTLKPRLKFAISIAFTSTIWVFITQSDKLILSAILPLSEYGYFTLAVLLASVLILLNTPVKSALLPRFTKLEAQNNEEDLFKLYDKVTQLMSAISISVACILYVYSVPILWAWTGDMEIVNGASITLEYYVVGYYFLSVSAFPFYLQFAKGKLRLHVWGNVLLGCFLVPSIVYFTMKFGVLGAGLTWLATHVIYFLFWVPLIHKEFLPYSHVIWLLRTIVPHLVVFALFCFIVGLDHFWESRVLSLLIPCLAGLILLFFNLLVVRYGRSMVFSISKFIIATFRKGYAKN